MRAGGGCMLPAATTVAFAGQHPMRTLGGRVFFAAAFVAFARQQPMWARVRRVIHALAFAAPARQHAMRAKAGSMLKAPAFGATGVEHGRSPPAVRRPSFRMRSPDQTRFGKVRVNLARRAAFAASRDVAEFHPCSAGIAVLPGAQHCRQPALPGADQAIRGLHHCGIRHASDFSLQSRLDCPRHGARCSHACRCRGDSQPG